MTSNPGRALTRPGSLAGVITTEAGARRAGALQRLSAASVDEGRSAGRALVALAAPNSGLPKAHAACGATEPVCALANGELHNRAELSAALELHGHRFQGDSDVEVLAHSYEQRGRDLLRSLRGGFAFAAVRPGEALLARDRLGVKPLYYALAPDGSLAFASQVKHLLAAGIEFRLDLETVADVALLGHAVGPKTFFQGIHQLQPGHALVVRPDGGSGLVIEELMYHRLDLSVASEPGAADRAVAQVAEKLREVLSEQLSRGDAGIALSGGLDSAILAVLSSGLARASVPLATVVDDLENPELELARRVRHVAGGEHRVITLSFDDYLAAVADFLLAVEFPAGPQAVPFLVLCRRLGTSLGALLIGEGADEVFGGCADYLNAEQRIRRIAGRVEHVRRLGLSPSAKAMEQVEQMTAARGARSQIMAMFELHLTQRMVRHHLEVIEKLGMNAGVQLRYPYLDQELVALVMALPLSCRVDPILNISKPLLKRLLLTLPGGLDLAEVAMRQKVGLPAAGFSHYTRLRQVAADSLPEDYLNRHELGSLFASEIELLAFQLFLDLFLRWRCRTPGGFTLVSYMEEGPGVG